MIREEDKRAGDFGHGGNLAALAAQAGCAPGEILDFSANLNPLGPPEWLRRVVSRHVEGLGHYPDPRGEGLLARLAEGLGVGPEQLLLGNGSTELLYAIPRAFACRRAVIPVPAYLDYERAARLAGLEVVTLPLVEAEDFCLDFAQLVETLQPGDLLFLGRPNNPTGVSFAADDLLVLAAANPTAILVVDESFFEFVAPVSELLGGEMPANLLVVRSLTKFYAIPGLRLGFAAGAPAIIARLRQHILPWTANGLALAVGEALTTDREYGERSRLEVQIRRTELVAGLAKIPGLTLYPGAANYLLVRLEKPWLTAAGLAERLLTGRFGRPIAIRVCANYPGLDDRYFRVAVRTAEENTELCAALARVLAPRRLAPACHRCRKTPALMLQGTASNAGKSVLTAALGRIFLQDGYRVAPFKAQNMSLNSFVTRDGGEMGRAQVVQAQACRLDPEVRMNPVLLKPSSEVGCQVIVNGRVVGNMSVEEYIRYKPVAARAACTAYDSLADEYEVMVLEGAGSPAEVNLKNHDIVNMAMARHAEAQVLLVGDIDRGGVFAAFVGSLEVLAEWERRLVAGFLVNRFRGRAELLADAYEYLLNHTGKSVFGTVPYLPNLGLPEEDSVGFKGGHQKPRPSGDHVTIGVVDLPHISNFTDVEPFLAEPDVHLLIIRSREELAAAGPELAALILPGSKNVMHDLDCLRQSGLADQIKQLAAVGETEIIGICGGFQMLGRTIADPHHLESASGGLEGLGILEMTTTLAAEKTLIQQSGLHLPSHLKVHGYEIHHGQTVAAHPPALRLAAGAEDGAVSVDGRVWGSYLHGIFDDDDFRRWFIDMLRSSRNLMPLGSVVAPYDLEPAFERLASVVREAIDLPKIYRLLGLR